MYENLLRYIHEKLDSLDRKVGAGEELADYEVQCGDMLAHFEKSLRTSVAMEESNGGYSSRGGRSYADGYTDPMMHMRDMNRGNSYRDDGRRRSPMSREGGYSRADHMEDVVQAVGGAMDDMPEDLRREAQRFLNKMQQRM